MVTVQVLRLWQDDRAFLLVLELALIATIAPSLFPELAYFLAFPLIIPRRIVHVRWFLKYFSLSWGAFHA